MNLVHDTSTPHFPTSELLYRVSAVIILGYIPTVVSLSISYLRYPSTYNIPLRYYLHHIRYIPYMYKLYNTCIIIIHLPNAPNVYNTCLHNNSPLNLEVNSNVIVFFMGIICSFPIMSWLLLYCK